MIPQPTPLAEATLIPTLCESFRRATGWSLRYLNADDMVPKAVWSERLGEPGAAGSRQLSLEAPDSIYGNEVAENVDPHEWDAIEELASSVSGLLKELEKTRTELWKREAELAAGVPVTPREDENEHFASRLESVLRAGAEAVGCQAAAAYLLDDSTRHLKLRSCWGLPKSRFLDAARPLRGSVADLEALVGHAVVLEDAQLLSHWRVPEEFRSAVCVPISSPALPFGTLWMFCDRSRDFSQHETNLIEIVAGRIAAELERQILLQQSQSSQRLNRQLLHATQWQTSRLPKIKPLLDSWEIAGWTTQSESIGGDFHDWSVLPDGRLAVAVADAQGSLIEAGLTAASVHTALKAHAGYRHSAREMIGRLNETLWTASSGDQFASMLYGLIEPATGELEYSYAGHVRAVAIGDTTTKLVKKDTAPLGTVPESEHTEIHHSLGRGEIFVAISDGVEEWLTRSGNHSRLHQLWAKVRKNRHRSADELLDIAKDYLLAQSSEHPLFDQTVLVVKRS